MADDRTKTGSRDRELISVSEPSEVCDWCESLGCTDAELRAAVNAVGNGVDRVRDHLQSKR